MADPIITPATITLDADLGPSKQDVIAALAQRLTAAGRAEDADALTAAALAREEQSATGLPNGLAIPHCRAATVTTASLGFARLAPKVDFGASDGPADLVFLIAAPEGAGAEHMKLLSSLARALVKPEFVDRLRAAESADAVVALVDSVLEPAAGAGAAGSTASATKTGAPASPATSSAAAVSTAGSASPGSTPGPSAAGTASPAESAAARDAASPAGGAGAQSAVSDAASGAGALVGISADASDSGPHTYAATPPAGEGLSAEHTPASTRTIVAVTACPTGIAHTYMAADALVAAGERAGVRVQVETQGSSGTTPLSAATIAAADAVILATDVGVKDRERFAGKPVVESGVKRAINEPDAMIADALRVARDPAAARATTAAAPEPEAAALGWGTRLRQILLTGVSYMIPFVAAGGLLIALGFLVGGYDIADNASTIVLDNSLTSLPPGGLATYLGAVLYQLGSLAFSFLVPALAGYIAFAIADRPGLAPGFTAGAVAVFVGAGFLGGLVGGLIAGFAALWVSRIPVPQWARGLMPVVMIPLFASLIVGLLMLTVLGKPLAVVTESLTDWLNGLSGTSAVALGIILGLMMCFDLGGPVNKAAYSFAAAGLSVNDPATLKIMAAVMAAGMVPPLAMALASTVLRPGLFTPAERENGKAAWLLGASFISEGAIPFAAADPLRVIPSMMAGGAVTGALVMATGVTLSAPHGGIFVFFAVGQIAWYLVAIAAGTVTAAVCVTAAKSFGRARTRTDAALVTA
ncbi:PTS fructose transporter subunit IIABC [Nocardia cyriacigeorgica]|uniref:PTS fructose transporter subunit IIABC n=1 Tax=Nocardia cyriacigeorgica TaxID=135487 RepID=UPI00189588A6|nr:fructose-specific PTS transporter subunit EIIC [Nocardia cyriacigeorgica]MBF6289435.1 PTS sugar transporter subunit IIA [Nocardia cyriacigeorgica]